jgi:hypothetical protein
MRFGADEGKPSHNPLQDTSKKPWRGKQDTRGGSNVRNQSGHNPSKSTKGGKWDKGLEYAPNELDVQGTW